MGTAVKRRGNPYIWVSWLTKLLSGESQCVWSAWFRANHTYTKAPSDFDAGAWQIDHAAMLRTERKEQKFTTEDLCARPEG